MNTTKTKRIATFRSQDGRLLKGREARRAWAAQESICACGCHGEAKESVSGTVGLCPAEWIGCPNCTGNALGRPLVFRLPGHLEE